ncbi:MAG: enoyl-CoA hydratase-related protein, partial [Candidatus Nitrotoga sp.]
SATFRTLDVVGLDVFARVVDTMRNNLADDPWHTHFTLPDWLDKLIAEGALGQKTKRGVYQKVGNKIHVFDLGLQTYRLSEDKFDDAVKDMLRERDWAKKLDALHASARPQAQFLWAVFRDLFHYCAVHLEGIANNARDLDFAVRWGFGWDIGPFEIWQTAGWQMVVGWINEDITAGRTMSSAPLPGWVTDATRNEVHSAQGSYSPGSNQYQARSKLPVYNRQEFPDRLLGEVTQYGETIFETEAVRMWHSGNDIAILSFKTKMHIVSSELLDDILRALDEAEENWLALIIWQTEPPFSAGANLLQLMQGVQQVGEEQYGGFFGKFKGAVQRVKYTVAGGGGLSEIVNAATGNVARVEDVIVKFQRVSQRLKYAQVPTIAAVDGLALGGGCEISIHCTRIVAVLESYIGLVETGVGLLPSGGGCKEMAQRAAAEAKGGDIFPFLGRYFQNIAMGEVSKSAEQAREMGYLRASDRIVMNHFELLHVAKQEALALVATAYRPPLIQRQIPVAGRAGIASFKASMVNMLEGDFISEHDYAIGCRVAEVMCGGDVDVGSMVDEQWLLDLERRNFLELLAMDKTQERIEYMLRHSKPLRN